MISFKDFILKEFSSIEKDYSQNYRKYKRKLIAELDLISSPSYRRDYWKNIKLDFLKQEWKCLHSSSNFHERLTQNYLKELVGKNNYINIVFFNGFLYSLDDISTSHFLKLEQIHGDYDKLLEKKKEIFSYFQRKNLLKNWLLSFNEIINDEIVSIKLTEGKKLAQTVRLIFITDNDNSTPLICPQIFFNIEDGAELNLIEEHFSMGRVLNNYSLKFIIGENATVHHFLFQNESQNSIHINHTYVEQKKESNYISYVLQKGSQTSIVQKTINLIEEHSHCKLYGLSLPKNKQAFNNLTTIAHSAPETTSDQLYRGILEDETFLNFTGIVRVDHKSPFTNSGQLNQNLILSENATSISRPRLEILNDNVKCTHGATCRNINPEEFFYLKSRGIHPKDCKRLLIAGFAQDFYNHIKESFPEWKP